MKRYSPERKEAILQKMAPPVAVAQAPARVAGHRVRIRVVVTQAPAAMPAMVPVTRPVVQSVAGVPSAVTTLLQGIIQKAVTDKPSSPTYRKMPTKRAMRWWNTPRILS